MNIEKIYQDVEILKIENKKLQEELFNEKQQRLEISVVLVEILEKLKTLNIEININKEEVNVSLASTIQPETLTIDIDDTVKEKESLVSTLLDKESILSSMNKESLKDARELEENIENNKLSIEKRNIMNTIVDDIDILSDNDSLLSESEKDIIQSPKINQSVPPLPSNLRQSPMTPIQTLIVETKEEEKPIESIKRNETKIDYKKMKVADLKKLCKEKGIKGFSKMKKQQLIDLLE